MIALCRAEEIAEGEAKGFAPFADPRRKIFVVRRGGAFYAYLDACPHYGGTPMAWRTDAYLNAAGDRIVCASHGAEFDIESGRCTLGAALGQSLQRLRVDIDDDGALTLIEQTHREETST